MLASVMATVDPSGGGTASDGGDSRFRALIEFASDVITIVTPEGKILYVSPSARTVLGYEPESLVGASFELLHPDDRARAESALAECVFEHKRPTLESRIRHRNGSWRIFHSVLINLVDHPAVGGIVVTSRDISGLKLLEQRLSQADRLTSIGRLAAQVAHEFNNVLMGIQPLAQVLARRIADRPELVKFADLILKSVDRGRAITHDILRFARPPELVLQDQRADGLLNDAVETIRPLLGDKVTLLVESPDEPLWVRADRGQFIQALVNIALNARDATEGAKGASILIGARRRDVSADGSRRPSVEFFVTDYGNGIAEDHIKYIFEPLFTTKTAGTGLGLAVAHQVVQRHGGEIRVDSVLGTGTTFIIALPAGASGETSAPAEGSSGHPDAAGKRVLLVEDDENVAAGLSAALEMHGLLIDVARRGADAVASIVSFNPDAVVLDVSLPDIDGRLVFDEISSRWPDLPVIFSTAQVTPEELAGRLRRTNVKFLQKPYATEALLDALADLWKAD